ncbi:MAG TPA: hypothetical protein VK612_03705 [Pyrinomonadaceae bacterium]|nr:hypothetical protein [Pyrinomonadaceae bacterium]
MSLTTETLHRLRSKAFDKFYTQHQAKWKKCVENATTYVKSFIHDKDKPRPADIAEVLQNALKIDPDFEKYTAEKKLKEKYWVSDFADYIIDQIYPPANVE